MSATDAVHKIEVVAESDGRFTLRLVCSAAPGAPCRKRPADPEREEWHDNDPDLIDSTCWALEWVDAECFEDVVTTDESGVWASIPIKVTYDEGVLVRRVGPLNPT